MNITFTRIFPFIAWRKRAYGISGLIGLVLLAITVAQGGINLGIDFVGGTSIIVKFDRVVDSELLSQLRSWLEPRGLGGNIRTIGATGGSAKEAREISIDIRGSEWVDNMVATFQNLRTEKPGLTFADVEPVFAPRLEPAAYGHFVDYFQGDSETPALYELSKITTVELKDVFQTLFNENIALSVASVFSEHLPLNEEKKMFDINQLTTPERLAGALADVKALEVEAMISGLIGGETGMIDTMTPRPWGTVDDFISRTGLGAFDEPSVRRDLYDGRETAVFPGAVSVLTGSPRDLSRVFHGALTNRFLRNARIVISARDEQLDGLFATSTQAVDVVPADDSEMKSIIGRHFHAGRFIILQSETVGPSVGAEMKKNALWAIFYSMLGIMGYVWFRFELRFAVGAVVALVHDSLLTILLVSAMGWEFNVTIVAALLTVMGYSVNDTIVVYDRIREKLGKLKGPPDPEIIDRAITETLSRTVLTGGSLILSIIAFMVLGPLVTKDMSGTLAFGVIIGTFSSIFVASPVLVEWDRFAARFGRGKIKSKGDRARS